jgi:ferrous iron transport protein A
VLRFFARLKPVPAPSPVATPAPRRELPRVDLAQAAAPEPRRCALSMCVAGSRATILEMRCGDQEACRLRALGVCEGAHVDVVDDRHAMLLEVRGTRLALGRALTAGITVQPVAG